MAGYDFKSVDEYIAAQPEAVQPALAVCGLRSARLYQMPPYTL